jgi:hypothetical protein
MGPDILSLSSGKSTRYVLVTVVDLEECLITLLEDGSSESTPRNGKKQGHTEARLRVQSSKRVWTVSDTRSI